MSRNGFAFAALVLVVPGVLGALAFLLAGPAAARTDPFQAPLAWSVYENHFLQDQAGSQDNYISEADLQANVDWVAANLQPHGYRTICLDGWGDTSRLDANGYRTAHSRHWLHDYVWWAAELQARGLNLGMYDNPLWIHPEAVAAGATIVGTSLPVGSLVDPVEDALWFTWVQVDRPGAEQYVKGCVRHYAAMGIRFLRVDFLSWYETGYDRNLGTVGPARTREQYETALRWMREACDESGVLLSLVMPNLFETASLESRYGHMIRIDEDCAEGAWWRFSDKDRGHHFLEWSQYANACDGYAYWSRISGRGQVILDGDFIRLNTFATAGEKRSVISMHLVAGGPLLVADQVTTIGQDLWAYQNDELLALNADGLVGHPLSANPLDPASQVWTGQLGGGEWIVALFNREADVRTRALDFTALGLGGGALVRDLWQHADLGAMASISAELPPHGCLVLKLTDAPCACAPQQIDFSPLADRVYGEPDFAPPATADSGLPVQFEVALGPATFTGGLIHLTGHDGRVFVVATQPGGNGWCAAVPRVQSFLVSGGHRDRMYVAGTFTGWSPSLAMTLEGDVWTAREVAIPAGPQELKFADTSDWSGDDWGDASGLYGVARLTTGGAPNLFFTVPAAGSYTIRFDDLSLRYLIGGEGTAVGGAPPGAVAGRVVLAPGRPNPFNPRTEIRYELPAPATVTLGVYDLAGRLVRRLVAAERRGAGAHVIAWDGRDDAGAAVGAGTYLVRLQALGQVRARKIVLLR